MFSMFAIYYKSEKIPVYYYDATTSETTTTQTDAIRLQIAKEKMGNTNVPIVLSTMTNAKPDFTNLIFDENELTTGLLSSAEVVTLFPTSIKEFPDYVRLFFNDLYVDFDYLINTIPQPFFAPLVSSTETFKFNPLIFITSKVNEPNSMTYSYNNCFWKRKFVKQNSLCIEFNKEDFNEDQFKQEFPEITEYQKIEIPYGRISSSNVQDSKRIRHIGRFAQWDHSVTTEHSINKLINLNL